MAHPACHICVLSCHVYHTIFEQCSEVEIEVEVEVCIRTSSPPSLGESDLTHQRRIVLYCLLFKSLVVTYIFLFYLICPASPVLCRTSISFFISHELRLLCPFLFLLLLMFMHY